MLKCRDIQGLTYYMHFFQNFKYKYKIHRQKPDQIQIQIQPIEYKYKYKLRPRQNCRHFTDDIQIHSIVRKLFYLFKFHWTLFPKFQYTISLAAWIGSDNGLALNKQTSHYLTNDGPDYWCINASLDLNDEMSNADCYLNVI